MRGAHYPERTAGGEARRKGKERGTLAQYGTGTSHTVKAG